MVVRQGRVAIVPNARIGRGAKIDSQAIFVNPYSVSGLFTRICVQISDPAQLATRSNKSASSGTPKLPLLGCGQS
ncbi:hypothetical protein, partial [Lactobacillus crispatus]|uniref:hypothetical protein n=1 Tax=Lactobacillus crispatus TaxID=47770 RepID=UPI00197BEE74